MANLVRDEEAQTVVIHTFNADESCERLIREPVVGAPMDDLVTATGKCLHGLSRSLRPPNAP